MNSSNIQITYHSFSTDSLDADEEIELTKLMSNREICVSINQQSKPNGKAIRASILDITKVILVITGTFAGKIVLQEFVKDVYTFFKKKLKNTDKEKLCDHYAVIFKVESEGEKYEVSVDFKDEATLMIGFFRVHAFIQKPEKKPQMVEFEYPKEQFESFPLWIHVLTCIVGVFAIFGFMIFICVRLSNRLGIHNAMIGFMDMLLTGVGIKIQGLSQYLVIVIYILLAYVGFILSMEILKIIFSICSKIVKYTPEATKEWKDYWSLEDEAKRWILEITPISGMPKDTNIQIEFGDRREK